jgi:hypothetical protein
MADTPLSQEKGEGKVQTTNSEKVGSVESRSGKHNPKVIGSSPVAATNYKALIIN